MKVLLIGTAGKYGAQLSLVYLCKELQKKGIEIEVVLPEKGNTETYFIKDHIRYYIIKNGLVWTGENRIIKKNFIKYGKYIINWFAEYRIRRILKKDDIDIVHINSIGVGVGAKSAMKEHKKLVWHIREFIEEDLNRKLYNEEETYCLVNKADAVIAISEAVYAKYKQYIVNSNFQVVYNGVEPEVYFCENRDILKENSQIHIIVPGRVCYEKGQFLVIEALEYLEDLRDKIVVEFCGDGNGNNRELLALSKRINESYWAESVVFSGYCKHIELKYKKCDICIVPSKKEAFGRVTVEAMMAGCLVIGADSGGTKEILDDGRGLLFEVGKSDQLAEQIRWTMDNKVKARAMAQNAQLYALLHYSAKKNADDLEKIYTTLIDER